MVVAANSDNTETSSTVRQPASILVNTNGNKRSSTESGPPNLASSSRSVPEVTVNGNPIRPSSASRKEYSLSGNIPNLPETESEWGSNFWVTLVDPQTGVTFFACPANGNVSWEPPVGHFVLPPSEDGEWWELSDDTRGGIPYYYQTKTQETVWERPDGFVIPLGIIQTTSLGRRISQTQFHRNSIVASEPKRRSLIAAIQQDSKPSSSTPIVKPTSRRSFSNDHASYRSRVYNGLGEPLAPIPGSVHEDESGASSKSEPSPTHERQRTKSTSTSPSHVTYTPSKSIPQSLGAAAEHFRTVNSGSSTSHGKARPPKVDINSPLRAQARGKSPPSPSQVSAVSTSAHQDLPWSNRLASSSTTTLNGKPVAISNPVPNPEAMKALNPLFNGKVKKLPVPTHPPKIPIALASDIQQFVESNYAKTYFSTHKSGFIFKRKIPMEQMMTWQRTPLNSPLLLLKGAAKSDATKTFKVVLRVMGDRTNERTPGVPHPSENSISIVPPLSGAGPIPVGQALNLLEEQRWLISAGLTHGELRDEIYCQIMKQLTGNPSAESIFKGWQLLCLVVVCFPPSKDFETYLQGFIQSRIDGATERGRIDVMAKYCLKRLAHISKRGPKGKPPTVMEIETALDAAFNPSTFGESLEAVFRVQSRNYPDAKVPIILPFLADGILALGGTKCEGIFRVAGDGESVSELKSRIDRGYYTLDDVEDPHVLASLLKLWLRELCDPLIPEELYDECISHSRDPDKCVDIIQNLPTLNRRVVCFVISFMQLFLEERVMEKTKMTPANMALVMAPNLLRCNSESLSVVFANAQFEQNFVYNLLLRLKCAEVDPEYVPTHGHGTSKAVPPQQRTQKQIKSRRPTK